MQNTYSSVTLKDHPLQFKIKEYTIEPIEGEPYPGTHLGDMREFLKSHFPDIKTFFDLTSLYVPHADRGKGIGSKIIADFCDAHPTSVIVLTAGAHEFEYDEEPSEQEFEKCLQRLGRFYSQLGFVNINKQIGGYQFRCTYICNNEIGMQIIKHINTQQKTSLFK